MPLLRALVRHPRTAVPILLLLALGVGGFGWILGLRRSLLLRSLPVADPGSLVALWSGPAGGEGGTPSYGEYTLMARETEVFQGVAAVDPGAMNLEGDLPERVKVDQVTPNYFQVLGVAPAAGRDFRPGEDEPGLPRGVLLTEAFWRRRFGADPALIGQAIRLDGHSYEVLGLLPPGFHTPQGTELFRVLPGGAARRDNFRTHSLRVLARLRPGAGLPEAREAMARATRQLRALHPELFEPGDTYTLGATPLVAALLGPGAKVLTALSLAAALVLLIAALNAAALLLARTLARRRELAVRAALGASSASLRLRLVAEGALLGLGGALLGLLLARTGLGAVSTALSWSFPDLALEGVHLDPMTLAATLLAGPLVGALCAAWIRPEADLVEALKEGGRGQVGEGKRLRQRLVLAQLALATALLGSAIWIHGGLRGLLDRDLGFRPQGVQTFRLSPTRELVNDYPRLAALEAQVLARLRTIPGVEVAGALNSTPLSGFVSDLGLQAPGLERPLHPQARSASPGALPALGLRLVQGRDFTEADDATGAPVVLLTRNLARACFGEEPALGRLVRFSPDQAATVVGILEDFREFGPAKAAPQVFFVPYAQADMVWSRTLHVVFRCTGPAPSERTLRELLKEAAPGLGLHGYQPLTAQLDRTLGSQRLARACAAAFALLALLLSAGGIYGLMAATMAERRGEFGVRAALGATARDLLALVLGEASRLVLLGGLAGLALAALLRLLGTTWLGELPDPGPAGPLLAFGTVLAAALAAALPPAWRAAQADPMTALRAD